MDESFKRIRQLEEENRSQGRQIRGLTERLREVETGWREEVKGLLAMLGKVEAKVRKEVENFLTEQRDEIDYLVEQQALREQGEGETDDERLTREFVESLDG